jgi:YebC/PmpR family DNA-binding regulatory protein
MAGHSKWSQIKRTKAVVDGKRGALFTRLGREITVAARNGSDPNGNFQLRTAITKARSAGLPAGNIERAIAKGSGLGEAGSSLELVRYEGYGPEGIAVLVEALSDNRNRTAAEMRLAFSKHCGKLGETGCVSYLFQHRSEVRLEGHCEEEPLLENLLELDAEGYVLLSDGSTMVHGGYEALEQLQQGLHDHGWTVLDWEHCWHALALVEIHDPQLAETCQHLQEALESLDDVCSVSTNLVPIKETIKLE